MQDFVVSPILDFKFSRRNTPAVLPKVLHDDISARVTLISSNYNLKQFKIDKSW